MNASNALSRDDFSKIYQEFHPRVLMTCRRMLGSPEEAEDAANDVFVKLQDSLATYDASQPFARWLARVAGNHCIDLLRKRRSEQRVIEPAHHELPEPAAPLRSPFEDLLSKESSDQMPSVTRSLRCRSATWFRWSCDISAT
jgi:RNA polymerase sigma factor (sigma-70 family)